MSLNKWRIVHDLDDGQGEFQCLKCRKRWEAGYQYYHEPFVFCPWCGIQFEGELKWRPEWDSPEDKWRDLKRMHRRDVDALHQYDWIVEHKVVWRNPDEATLAREHWESVTNQNYDCDVHGRLPYIEKKDKKSNALFIYHSHVDHEKCDRTFDDLGYAYRLALYEDYWNRSGGREKVLLAVCKEYHPFKKKELDN